MKIDGINGIITLSGNYKLRYNQKFELSKTNKRLNIVQKNDLGDCEIIKSFNVKNILGTF